MTFNDAQDYWDTRFSEHASAYVEQNHVLSRDFLKMASRRDKFRKVLVSARTMLDVGCGTGEMSALLKRTFKLDRMLGIDISHTAVALSSERYTDCEFRVADILAAMALGTFDLAISSHVLQLFRRPHEVIKSMLVYAPVCIAIVPYMQPCVDGYDCEGGAGHVFTFDEKSFADYEVLDWWVYRSGGWQYSSKGEKPLLLAVLFRAKGT